MVELTYLSLKKTTFFVRVFNISPYVFTQILIGMARWTQNLITHPTSTHTAYFWRTLLPQKQEIPEKTWWCVIITFLQVFLVFGVVGSVKSMHCGYSLNAELNSTSNELYHSEFEETHTEICRKYEQKKWFFLMTNVNSTIMVDLFYRNYIASWIPTHKIYCWRIFLYGPF